MAKEPALWRTCWFDPRPRRPGAVFTCELTRGGEERLAQGGVTTTAEKGWSTFRQQVAHTVPARQRIDLVV